MNKIIEMVKKYLTAEIIAYLICGVLPTILSLSIYSLCIWLDYSIFIANTISFVIAVLFAYVTNKIFVFKSFNHEPSFILMELGKFTAGRLVTYAVETILLVVLIDYLLFPKILTKFVTSVIVIILNYAISKLAVFKGTNDSKDNTELNENI